MSRLTVYRFKLVGRQIRQIRFVNSEKRIRAFREESEVIDALLPGKVSKHQITKNRTPNRHRWTSREY